MALHRDNHLFTKKKKKMRSRTIEVNVDLGTEWVQETDENNRVPGHAGFITATEVDLGNKGTHETLPDA